MKFDSLSTQGFDARNCSLRRIKLFSVTFMVFEFIIDAYFLLNMVTAQQSTLKQIQWGLTFYARFFMVVLEQLANLICVEIRIRFCILNESIRSWRPKPQFFYKVLGPSTLHAFGGVKNASTQFSNLSLALQAVQDQFGLFWLLNVIHLGAIMIVTLSMMPTFGINLTYSTFIALAMLRLVLFCDVCGDTSSQVRF